MAVTLSLCVLFFSIYCFYRLLFSGNENSQFQIGSSGIQITSRNDSIRIVGKVKDISLNGTIIYGAKDGK